MRHHKGFSDIEADIRRYYEDGTVDAELTALKVAARALGISQNLVEPINKLAVEQAKLTIFNLVSHRQTELERTR